MEPLGIVSKTKKGIAAFYRINKGCIIHRELRRIFLKLELAQYTIRYALICGSFARGTETESSGMDLLVIGQVSKDRFYEPVSSLESKMGRVINAIVWDYQQFSSQESPSPLSQIKLNEIIMVRGTRMDLSELLQNRKIERHQSSQAEFYSKINTTHSNLWCKTTRTISGAALRTQI